LWQFINGKRKEASLQFNLENLRAKKNQKLSIRIHGVSDALKPGLYVTTLNQKQGGVQPRALTVAHV